jgi:4-amino-4-deoxy-L-arabinose transferase-like glycosyltransferase
MEQRIKKWLGQRDRATDWLWSLGLLIAALLLFGVNLGGLPLRDWDEGIVAQVAREIWRSPPDSLTWLYPTLWDAPYFNKPLLVHWLIAIAYSMGGVSEWTSRLPGALLTTLSVPLLYKIGREIFHRRPPAIFAALIYLTTLPVVRHGRLAMLDGAILCFLLLMLWCLLRARRDNRYALGIGIGLGLICLTKGLLVGVLVGAIACLFLAWDTPRLLTTPHLWLGILIGSIPVVFWYGAQWGHYGQKFFGKNLVNQSLSRIWTTVEDNTGPPWYYLLEILKYGFPWLLFLPQGLKLAWENRNLSWAKLALVWSGVYFAAVSLMATKLPWYILPIYPALALIGGAQLAVLWNQGRHEGIKHTPSPYSPVWIGIFAVLALVGWAGAIYFGYLSAKPEADLQLILMNVGITMTVVAVLVARQNPQFLAVLIWGTYLSLLLLMLSDHWVWELAEAYPVKPVAEIIQQNTPVGQKIYTSYPLYRPSLNFYSDRQIIPATPYQLRQQWRRKRKPYLLLDSTVLQALELEPKRVLGSAESWTLITRTK